MPSVTVIPVNGSCQVNVATNGFSAICILPEFMAMPLMNQLNVGSGLELREEHVISRAVFGSTKLHRGLSKLGVVKPDILVIFS